MSWSNIQAVFGVDKPQYPDEDAELPQKAHALHALAVAIREAEEEETGPYLRISDGEYEEWAEAITRELEKQGYVITEREA